MVAEPLTLYPASQDTVIVSWNFGKVVEDTLPFIISGIGHVISVKKKKKKSIPKTRYATCYTCNYNAQLH